MSAILPPIDKKADFRGSPNSPRQGRLLSLDVMRGMTMMAMILVNNPGSWSSIYPPLEHAHWHGWTPTDLIYPLFLFMVGVAMVFSLDKRWEAGQRLPLLYRILRRTALLFLIGWFLGLFPDIMWDPGVVFTGRWPGVLQRIAICYALASSMVLFFPARLCRWMPAILMTIYLVEMLWFPVPGYGAGVWEVEGNFCWYLDHLLLAGHTWSGAPVSGFDPEGVWSTLPAVVNVLLGYFVGRAIRPLAIVSSVSTLGSHSSGGTSSEDDAARSDVSLSESLYPTLRLSALETCLRLFVLADLSWLIAYVLSGIIPINKQLWTPTFVFLTVGFAIQLLVILFYCIDLLGWRRWTLPFVILGENAIFAYCLSSMGGDLLGIHVGDTSPRNWLFTELFEPALGSQGGSLAMACLFVLICLAITSILHYKRWLIRI